MPTFLLTGTITTRHQTIWMGDNQYIMRVRTRTR